MPTLAEALQQAARDLGRVGIVEARTDARLLLCAATGLDRAALVRDPDRPLTPEQAERFAAFLARRCDREPVSRILGRRAFWGLDLGIGPDVLDPRPDTETVVDAALRHVGHRPSAMVNILDLGTGSGAILCALLSELPAARACGVERSYAACRVAWRNLQSCGFASRALVVQADWSQGLAAHGFDIVVSNPPYIETATIETLDEEVRRFDPLAALDGGADGLDAYRAIAAQLPNLLVSGGVACLEVGFGQADAVSDLLLKAGLAPAASLRDLAGIERVVCATAAAMLRP